MFLAILENKSYEKYLLNIFSQIKIPIILNSQDNYFSRIEIIFTQKTMNLKSSDKILKISLPLTLKNLQNAFNKILSDYKIIFQNASYHPIKHCVIFEDKKVVLGEIHNQILSQLILNQKLGIDKFDLYQKIWPLDKDIQINKLETHLTNFRNNLLSNLNFKIQFSSNKGLIKLN